MAPSFGIMSIISPPSGVPPAVIMARTGASSSAENTSLGRLPAASISSKRCPMRSIIAFGKREYIRTCSGIGRIPDVKTKGRNRSPRPPLTHCCTRLTLVQASRLDLHARSHGRGDRDALDVGTLGAGRLRLGDRIRERLDVLDQLLLGKRRLADTGLHDAGLPDPELDPAALGALSPGP